jgi:hypothetical protein
MIYLASPYTHPDPAVREDRYRAAFDYVTRCTRIGIKKIFSPIVYTHHLAKIGDFPVGFEFWRSFDFEMLTICNELWVLKLPGWENSKGIKEEIEYARSIGIPVLYIDPIVYGEGRTT